MCYGRRQSGLYERHVNVKGRESRYSAVEVISQADVDIAHFAFSRLLVAPIREHFEQLFDGDQQAGHGGFDGGVL